jgi:hypothetical protein
MEETTDNTPEWIKQAAKEISSTFHLGFLNEITIGEIINKYFKINGNTKI